MKKLNGLVLSTLTAAFLVGCGGGSSDSSSGGQQGQPQTNVSYSGSVIDGYIKNANVCLDLSLDGVCDNSEPSTKTDSNGAYSLIITPTQQNHQNFSIAPLIAFGGTDIDTGADFIGKLQAQVSGTTANVTPLTTILSKLIQDEVTSSTSKTDLDKKIAEKKEQIRTSFNLPKDTKIDEDFVKSKNNELYKTAIQIQKTIDTIVEIGSTGAIDKKELSNNIFDVIKEKLKTSNSNTDILNGAIEEIKTSTKISGLVFDDSKKAKLDLAKKNIDFIKEKTTSIEDMVTLIEKQKDKIKSGEEIEEHNESNLPTGNALKILALENFLKVLNLDISLASSLFDDGVTKENIISKFTDTTQVELHSKYSLVKNAVELYNKKLEEQSKTKSFAVQAIEVLEKMNIETDNVDSKIQEARAKVDGLSENDAVMVQNMLDLTKIVNSEEVSKILEIKSNSLNETSTVGKLVKSTVLDTVTFSEKYNGIASNSIVIMNQMATQLKKTSDSIGKVFQNQDYVFAYGNETMTYNDSLVLRGAILAAAFKLDFIASYSWGDDEDIRVREIVSGPITFEYENISVDPANVLNRGTAFKLSNASRLDGARAYLIEGLELVNQLPDNYKKIENTLNNVKGNEPESASSLNTEDFKLILNSIKGNGSYELVDEWEEFSWDYTKWQQDNSYRGDRTTYREKYYVDLSKLLNSTYAIDITSFGSDFELTCNDGMELSDKYTYSNNSATCVPKTSQVAHTENARVFPKIKPTTATSKLDDVVTKIITLDNKELTGQEVIDFILDEQK